MSMKNALTPAGIEPATFRIVAQHLNHCATAIPPVIAYLDLKLDALTEEQKIIQTKKLIIRNLKKKYALSLYKEPPQLRVMTVQNEWSKSETSTLVWVPGASVRD